MFLAAIHCMIKNNSTKSLLSGFPLGFGGPARGSNKCYLKAGVIIILIRAVCKYRKSLPGVPLIVNQSL